MHVLAKVKVRSNDTEVRYHQFAYGRVRLFLRHQILYDSSIAVWLICVKRWSMSCALIWNSFFRQEKPPSLMIPRDPTSSVTTLPLYPADLALSKTSAYLIVFRSAACLKDDSKQTVSSINKIFFNESSHHTISGRRSVVTMC